MTTPCPKCLKDDQVEKVSAVYSSGKTGFDQTELSITLAPPSEPVQKGYGSWPVAFVMLIIACLLFPAMSGLQGGTRMFVGGGIFLLAVLIALRVNLRNYRKNKEEYEHLFLAWKKKKSTWEDLYFCHRDDSVFDPKTGRLVSRRDMDTLYD